MRFIESPKKPAKELCPCYKSLYLVLPPLIS
jgi:hypothetical protein